MFDSMKKVRTEGVIDTGRLYKMGVWILNF